MLFVTLRAVLFLVLCSPFALASGDYYSCYVPRGNIFLRTHSPCDSVPFLSPSNDTRLNLQLLLIDAGRLTASPYPSQYVPPRDVAILLVPFRVWLVQEATPRGRNLNSREGEPTAEYAQGEGSRCSTSGAGLHAFEDAVGAAGLPSDEASMLQAARGSLTVDCDARPASPWMPPKGLHSELGRQFAIYIAGTDAFYAGRFTIAVVHFQKLTHSSNDWLKETSQYMLGRTLINSAQAEAFGEWGELKPESADKANLKDAEAAFELYLRRFPHGRYAASARGLLRRVYWLGGDQNRLAASYERAFTSPKDESNVTLSDLVQEFDSKLLPVGRFNQITSPHVLAVIDLMRTWSGSGVDELTEGEHKRNENPSRPCRPFTTICARCILFTSRTSQRRPLLYCRQHRETI